MRKLFIYLMAISSIAPVACTHENTDNMILVKGGAYKNTKSNLFGKEAAMPDFYINKYEVTQAEWQYVMGNNPSTFKGDNLPVETVSWYECVEYCNKRSIMEDLQPFYTISKNTMDSLNISDFDSVKWTITLNVEANGYRLPTEAEWEYAAGGGQMSKHFTYSGSDEIDRVAWYWRNSGIEELKGDWQWMAIQNNKNRSHPVGTKKPNELGLYDMSGNVREWCEDWFQDDEIKPGYVRVQRGGGWFGGAYRCKISTRHHFEASGVGPDQGFRVCRSISIP